VRKLLICRRDEEVGEAVGRRRGVWVGKVCGIVDHSSAWWCRTNDCCHVA